MDYASFRAWRDRMIAAHAPRRLDCMNPEVALAHLRPVTRVEAPSADELHARWCAASGIALPRARAVLGAGVRDLLSAVFATLPAEHWWLPDDVYPVYWELSASHAQRSFSTIGGFDTAFLDSAGPRDALLLPLPLIPVGRWPSAHEVARLLAWLDASADRHLVVDAAYWYARGVPAVVAPLVEHARTFVLWSMSKPWLGRGALGVAAVPASRRERLQSRVAPPSESTAMSLLKAGELPSVQEARFRDAWARLDPVLRAVHAAWRSPGTGYFAVLPTGAETLLARHRLLAVPASVFGSPRADLSIVTCLYDIELHDGVRAP